MVRGRGVTQFIAARLSGRRPAASGGTSPYGPASVPALSPAGVWGVMGD